MKLGLTARRRRAQVLLGAIGVVTLVACVPPTGGGGGSGTTTTSTTTTTTSLAAPPVIGNFDEVGGPWTSPAVVTFTWSVSDPNGDDLTCRIDHDSDGTWDVTVPHCQIPGSRDFDETTGSHVASFDVTDNIEAPVFTASSFTVAAGPSEPYDIVLRPVAPLAPAVQAAFDAAAARWEGIVVRGVPDLAVSLSAGECLAGAAAFSGTVDDLMIDVDITPIDGVGNILGQAGPCVISAGDHLTRTGVMEFDSADVAQMLANGTFTSVVTHEMGHLLGIGTLWDVNRSLLTGAGTSDPRFVGVRGVAEWSTLGGSAAVPVENTGGSGTADSHWRETTFGTELMTGYISPGSNPLSKLSIASLADLGYHVNRSVADAYSLPAGSSLRAGVASTPGVFLRPPIFTE